MAKKNILTQSKLQKAQKAIKTGKLINAAKTLKQLYDKDSADISIWLLLATVYHKMQNYPELTKICLSALSLDPANTAAMNYLGEVHSASKQYIQAIGYFKKSLEVKPGDTSVMYKLAMLLNSQNQTNEALVLLHQIIEIKTDDVKTLSSIVRICSQKGYYPTAIKYGLTLNKINPNNLEQLATLADCYANSRQTDDARDTYLSCLPLTDKPEEIFMALANNELFSNQPDHLEKAALHLSSALKAAPNHLNARIEEAKIWYRQGDFKRAYTRIKELIKDGHINLNVITIYALFCHRFGSCDYVIEQATSLLANQSKPISSEAITLHFNLGRIFDKKADFKQAFKHYQLANEAQAIDYHHEVNAASMGEIIKAYPKDNTNKLKHSTITSELPVFVVGMPRSGTSLVEQILASHEQIHGAGELQDFGNLAESFIPSEFNLKESYPGYSHSLTTNQLDACAKQHLTKLSSYSNTALRIIDKMPQNFLYLGLISQLFPQATIIHCTRHPLDTILSIYFQNFNLAQSFSFDLKNIALYYLEYQKLMKHWNEALDIKILEVPYSNLVENFEGTCRKMINFTHLQWDNQCLHFHESKRTIATASHDQIRSPIYQSSLNRWENYKDFLTPLKQYFPELLN